MSIELYPSIRQKRRNIPCENPDFRKGPFVEYRECGPVTLEGDPNDPIDLTGKWGDNYTHWMLDIFSGVLFAEEAKVFPETTKLASESKNVSYVKESLLSRGYLQDYTGESSRLCRVENPLAYTSLAHPQAIKLLQQWAYCFLPPCTLWPEHSLNLLVQRGCEGTGSTQSRNFIERDEITKLFRQLDMPLFTVYIEGTSIAQQAYLFSRSKLIIAAHGSALTNIMFCKPECRVIEVASKSRHNQTYSDIASYLDFPMVVIEGEEKKLHGEDKDYCLSVDPQKLLKIAQSL